MPRLSVAERLRVNRMAFDRARRSAAARALNSPLLRWRYGAAVADELLVIPQDLRTADPSFASEMEQGDLGLGGAVIALDGLSPFDIIPPTPGWARELHGFGWLRHLQAADDGASREIALSIIAQWVRRFRPGRGVAWEPAVAARRIISWLNGAAFILENVPADAYGRTADSLGEHLVYLSAVWRDAPSGQQRLLALIGLLYGHLCIAGHDRRLADVERAFVDEIGRQILPDGGHVSRNPNAMVELLLDLLPLRVCFAARDRKPPPLLDQVVRRMMPMLRFMRLGDGTLARFNGMGAAPIAELATVLGYDDRKLPLPLRAPQSHYVRLQSAGTIVLVDAGGPPLFEFASAAHAGCLSFEMSAGIDAIFVNKGAPGIPDQDWRPVSRATASHNTLCLDGQSSSKLLRNPRLEKMLGGAPIRLPRVVHAQIGESAEGVALEAYHDGYIKDFGLLHQRRLTLAPGGARLDGIDRLRPAQGHLRFARDVPFAVHFHLHPDVACTMAADQRSAELRLGDGSQWLFSGSGAELSLEDSLHLADLAGPRASRQIVLRGSSYGETDVHWRIERLPLAERSRAPLSQPPPLPPRRSEP